MTSPTRSGTRGSTRVGGRIGSGGIGGESPVPSRPVPLSVQDQSCDLTVGSGLCGRSADAHPTVSATFLGLDPIA